MAHCNPMMSVLRIWDRMTEWKLMPSKSAKQARTMRAAAHDPAFAKKMGIPQSVAKDFVKADKKKSLLGKRHGKSLIGGH